MGSAFQNLVATWLLLKPPIDSVGQIPFSLLSALTPQC